MKYYVLPFIILSTIYTMTDDIERGIPAIIQSEEYGDFFDDMALEDIEHDAFAHRNTIIQRFQTPFNSLEVQVPEIQDGHCPTDELK